VRRAGSRGGAHAGRQRLSSQVGGGERTRERAAAGASTPVATMGRTHQEQGGGDASRGSNRG
jgi:hypothetical protein